MRKYILYLSFWIWVTSFNMFSRSFHLPANFKMSFFPPLYGMPLYKCTTSFYPFFGEGFRLFSGSAYYNFQFPSFWVEKQFSILSIFCVYNVPSFPDVLLAKGPLCSQQESGFFTSSLRSSWSIFKLSGLSGLHSEMLSDKT